ncbi:MAG TPA: acyltransferase [Allosphingosinicella sp.]|jgi:peptidoglycan/LPS O-acetylase OafA/YrhL
MSGGHVRSGLGEPKADLPALTGLRGVAAWFVVLYHIRVSAGPQVPPEALAVLAKGYLAVDLFFMLSGFVLWLNYADRLRAQGLAAAPLFLARRLARIWPLHLFILAGAIAFAGLLQALGKINPATYPWAELPLHVLLVQNWGFTGALTWNVPAWSISCEWAAYLLFPFLVLAIDWRKVGPVATVAAIMLLSILLSALMHSGGASTLGADVPRFGLARALSEFAIGTAVCGLWLRWRDRLSLPLSVSALLSLTVATAWFAGLLSETVAVPLAFAALLLALALTGASGRNPLGSRPVHYLGRISYATYLVHYLLFIAFKILFVEDAANVPLPLLGLFLILTFAASAALHHLVELPAQRWANRALSRSRKAPPALSAA